MGGVGVGGPDAFHEGPRFGMAGGAGAMGQEAAAPDDELGLMGLVGKNGGDGITTHAKRLLDGKRPVV